MKIGIVGAVNSTMVTLKSLIKHQFDITLVMGFEPIKAENVSGLTNMRSICEDYNLNYVPFVKINDHAELIEQAELDVLFVVGFSQLVCQRIIDAPKLGAVGFHPTDLPKGRGRAPIAWLVANQQDGAANFFVINDIADSGPIFVKQHFALTALDDATTVEQKILVAIEAALDEWLPQLKQGIWAPVAQEHSQASEYGIRKPEDGLIDWSLPAVQIDRLIKAAAPPHPGAFSFFKKEKMLILSCRLEQTLNIQGIIGRVLKVEQQSLLIQTGKGLLWIDQYQCGSDQPKIGEKLGFDSQLEIYHLFQELAAIKQAIGI